MRTGVVLGGGGYVGHAFHAGVLDALAEAGFDARRADVLVGTSAGSIVAAALAGGLSPADQAAELVGDELSPEGAAIRATTEQLPERLAPRAARGRRPLAAASVLALARRPGRVRLGAVAAGLLPAGTTDSSGLARGPRRLFGDRWPDGLRITAVRARDARRVVFGTPRAPRTDVGTAVAASCAIPAYFEPAYVDGVAYVDGGMHSPTNADVLVRDGLDLVVILSALTSGPNARRPRVDAGMRLSAARRLRREVVQLRSAGARVVVLQPGAADLEAMGINPMLGARLDEVIATTRATTRGRLATQPELAALLGSALP